jgi:hypothetical protein
MYVLGLNVKYLLFLLECNEALVFLISVYKNTQIQNLMKILTVEVKLFHGNRPTHIAQLIFAFRNFRNAPKKSILFDKAKLL